MWHMPVAALLGFALVSCMAVKKHSGTPGSPFRLLKRILHGMVFFARLAGTKLSLLQPSSSSVIVFLVSALASAE